MTDEAHDQAERRRRAFLAPRRQGTFRGHDLATLAPADPEQRHILVLADQPPEIIEGWEQELPEVQTPLGPMDPVLQVAIYEAIETLLWEDTVPGALDTAVRLAEVGYPRAEVLRMLISALSQELLGLPSSDGDIPVEERLAALPGSWLAASEEHDADLARRVAFLAPRHVIDALDDLDLSSGDGRRDVVYMEHHLDDGSAAWSAEHADLERQGAHLAMHEAIAAQVWDQNPPEVWLTAKRLLEEGYPRHQVLHMLAGVLTETMNDMLRNQRLFDPAEYASRLDALPGDWALRP